MLSYKIDIESVKKEGEYFKIIIIFNIIYYVKFVVVVIGKMG